MHECNHNYCQKYLQNWNKGYLEKLQEKLPIETQVKCIYNQVKIMTLQHIPIFYLLPAKSNTITYYRQSLKNSIGNYLCTKVTPYFQIESTGILYNSELLTTTKIKLSVSFFRGNFSFPCCSARSCLMSQKKGRRYFILVVVLCR